MATRQAAAAGSPFPAYVNETTTNEAVVAGSVNLNETSPPPSPPASPQAGIGWFESEW